jgi:penicillin amidase
MPPSSDLRCLWFGLLLATVGGGTAAKSAETLSLAPLRAEVRVFTDPWGIDHIEAENEHDLFFTQGFRAARNRLFQFEMWRRQATGTTAEILGPSALERDIGARLHRFRGDMRRELAHYHPRGESIVAAFVAGVNAWIDLTEADPGLLPLEFQLLNIKPGKWTPEVVVSRHQGLFGNVTQEIKNLRALAVLGPDKMRALSFFHPGDPNLEAHPSIDIERLLERDVLKLYNAFRAPLKFGKQDLAASAIESDEANIGSNNWVISGSLSASGKPMLANDPHRSLQTPSLRYFVHLRAPGWNVIGGGEPALPGVSIGHNEHGAWGLTIFRTDMEDLLVYETHPEDAHSYRYGDGWESMTVERETFHIKGADPVTVDLKFTRHGPVLHEDAERRTAYALRAAWLETGCAPYLASLRLNQAENFAEFRRACAYHQAPPLNMVWAGRDGDIGWQVSAITPVRQGWSGLIPVPGDGSHEWDHFLPMPLLPNIKNPPAGFWSTANQHVTPPDYPYPGALGFSWSDPQRGNRLREVLASRDRFTPADLAAIQHDELSIPARTLTPLLRDLPLPDGPVSEARGLLLDWDFVLDRDSVEAGIYVAWERALHRALRDRLVPADAREAVGDLSMQRMLEALVTPDARLGSNPVTARDSLLTDCLEEAVNALSKKFGPDRSAWRYGQADYKHALIRHPMSAAVNPEIRARLDVGPLPRGGDGNTVNNTSGADNQATGATFRVVIDTADWDTALATSAPGQSGNPDSPHYADLFPLWAQGRYFPLLYSREKIEATAETMTLLKPAP